MPWVANSRVGSGRANYDRIIAATSGRKFPLFWPDTSTFNSSDVFMEDEAWANLLRSTANEWWPDGA